MLRPTFALNIFDKLGVFAAGPQNSSNLEQVTVRNVLI
jgi:hypothetical protein